MRRPTRFDTALMTPPPYQSHVDAALLQRVRAWCEAGALLPTMRPLQAASIAPDDGLDGVACALDGSHALAELGRWRGLAWRLQLVLLEMLPGNERQAAAPWDCGWWRPGNLQAAAAFRPRRATLLLLRESDADAAGSLLAALSAHSASYQRPLRVLVLSARPMPGMPRL